MEAERLVISMRKENKEPEGCGAPGSLYVNFQDGVTRMPFETGSILRVTSRRGKKAKEREGLGLHGEREKSWQKKIIVKNNPLILDVNCYF